MLLGLPPLRNQTCALKRQVQWFAGHPKSFIPIIPSVHPSVQCQVFTSVWDVWSYRPIWPVLGSSSNQSHFFTPTSHISFRISVVAPPSPRLTVRVTTITTRSTSRTTTIIIIRIRIRIRIRTPHHTTPHHTTRTKSVSLVVVVVVVVMRLPPRAGRTHTHTHTHQSVAGIRALRFR